jgi:O-antigen/teichoic acid export membrane protein
MATYQQNTRLMAKNSAFLYIQMAIKMVIGLYTVRIILHALGAEDYGIYNVVGGFVTMFAFITGSLESASLRFFACAMGIGEYKLLNRYYNVILLIFIILAIILFLVIEFAGLWFVNYKMVVSQERLVATNWVLQFSIFAFIARILSVPASALLVAHEKMIVYASVHILDTFLILGIAFLLQIVSVDKLIIYAICMLGVSLLTSMIFIYMSHRSYQDETKLKLHWDCELSKELLSYCGWYMFGTMASVCRSQGINMLLNVFFNPVVNAARAIAYQIISAINQFINSFYQAVRPQITKLTAAEENQKMLSLVFSSSVISFLLMCLIAIPMLIEMPFILSIWLGDFPEYTVIFSRLVIITALIDTLGIPPTTSICANGDIKWFQITTGLIVLMNLPVSYFALCKFQHPYIVFYISIVLAVITQIVRLVYMRRMFGMSFISYNKLVLLRISVISGLSVLFTYILSRIMVTSIIGHIITILISVLFIALISFYYGINVQQRMFIRNLFMEKVSTLLKRG